MEQNYKLTKFSCYYTYLASASVFSLPPMLFSTFREMYNISYTLLGTLVLVNFCTQLAIDLIFSFFAKHFNIRMTIRIMPVLTSLGLAIYAIVPTLFPDVAYLGLVTGTFIFSVAAGLSEVLLSPLIAAIPSKTPERDMSTLHSLYAYGVFSVVLVTSLFIKIFGTENWMFLTLFFVALPIGSAILFRICSIPGLNISNENKGERAKVRNFGLFLCAICIFLGSAAENTMTNWISVYMEKALNISKAIGDIVGIALFAILLGAGRTLYAKYGKNISNVLLAGMIGATVCYLIAGFSNNMIICAVACAFTGFCTSMLWPGTLILMEEKINNPGVVAYALMAAGGDFGASVAPQALGIVVDKVSVSQWGTNMSQMLSINTEQFGIKAGMIFSSVFPILGVAVIIFIKRYFPKQKNTEYTLLPEGDSSEIGK